MMSYGHHSQVCYVLHSMLRSSLLQQSCDILKKLVFTDTEEFAQGNKEVETRFELSFV